MTTYRLMDGADGRPGVGSSGTQPPTSPTSYSGDFLAGTMFSPLGQVLWLQGFYFWCPTGGDTGAQKFCLWNRYSSSSQVLVPNTTVTSGTLTAGAWNYVALSSPVQLAPGALYVAATGWTSVHGFPDTHNQFGSGDPYVDGITNGPLTAWSDAGSGGTNNFAASSSNYGLAQGLFGTSSNDPTVAMPASGSNSANFWVDVLVSDTAPSGYDGSYRLWPNMADANNYTDDTANNFTLGVEFSLSTACTIDNIWFYSPSGVTQLPTEIGVYQVSDTTLVASNSSPSWSGTAGSGWVSAAMGGSTVLTASTNYKAVVLNGAGTPAIWNGAQANYWSTGYGGSGITAGPIAAPNTSTATSPGQDTYNEGASITFPATYAGPFNYWLDIEVTPQAGTPHTATAALTVTPSFSAARTRGKYRTAGLTVSPSFTAARTRGKYRTAALTVTPSFSAARVRAHLRAALLAITPSFLAVPSQVTPPQPAGVKFTSTPGFAVPGLMTPGLPGAPTPVTPLNGRLFAATTARLRWAAQTARLRWASGPARR